MKIPGRWWNITGQGIRNLLLAALLAAIVAVGIGAAQGEEETCECEFQTGVDFVPETGVESFDTGIDFTPETGVEFTPETGGVCPRCIDSSA